MPIELKFFFWFIVVLALIGVTAWVVRRFAARGAGASVGRGRMPRLAVIDAAAVDSRRRLVLVRRDNVEHLLMIGGPSDIVVEPNILRTAPIGREAAMPRGPATDTSWMENEPSELPAPMPEPPPRMPRPPIGADEPRRTPPVMPAPPPMQERRPEPRPEVMIGFTPDAMTRAAPPMRPAKPPMPRPPAAPVAPPVPPPAVAAADAVSQADQNLAEMAQRLEAALRRPGAEPRPSGPPVAVSPVDRIGAPSVAPESAPGVRPAEPANAAPEAKPDTAFDKPETGFESLEAEMASLLGRPKNPS
jgi:flagellar protein FliO/FliZ